MKRFRFRLERVLELRRQDERREQHRLAALVGALAGARARRHGVERQLRGCVHEAGRRAAAPSVAVQELVLVRGEIDALRGRARALDQDVLWLEESVARQQEVLAAAGRARLVLERLRARALAEHRHAERRAEALLLDDHRLMLPAREAA